MFIVQHLKNYLLEGYVEERSYRAKETVFSKALRDNGIFVVVDGVLELYIFKGLKKGTVDIMLPGDVFGFMSEESLIKYYVIKAITESRLFYLTLDNLKRLGGVNPALVLELFSSVLSKQSYLYEVFTAISMRKAKDRISKLLNLLGSVAEERNLILTLKKKQIADIVGLSYEGTVRTMKFVKNQKSRRVRLW
ncbi:MAG: Crp/Fnr family transcriptional regulator [Hydrogenobacter sp.]